MCGSEFPVTPQHDKKRNLSDITISPSSAEAKPKHTKAGSPYKKCVDFAYFTMHIISYNCTINYTQDHCNNVKVTKSGVKLS
jgi:hypothetical protein